MDFLNLPTALAAAALTIPPLVAMYFLKLKRQEVPIPSTLLWKRAVQDLQVNSPFQRLRNNLLLWLQLLILAMTALALARPIFMGNKNRAKSIVLLIDQSSSMNVEESDGKTRFQRVKEQAALVVDDMDEDDQAMIIAFSDRARMITGFTSQKSELRRLIDGLEPSEGASLLHEAVELAQAYSDPQIIAGETAGSDVTPEQTTPDAHMILFSDGRISDTDDLVLRRASLELVNVAETDDNVGIVALDVRRSYERPEVLSIFARVRNFSSDPVELDVSLIVGNRVADVQAVSLAPGRYAATSAPSAGAAPTTRSAAPAQPPPGSVGLVVFNDVIFEASGPLEIRLEHPDALDADNRAWAIVEPPRHVNVLLVTRGNYFLTRALDSLQVQYETVDPQTYETAPDDRFAEAGRSRFDVVIVDDHTTKRLPMGNYFFFGGVPDINGVTKGDPIENEIIVDWDDSHPILRHVNMDSVHIFSWNRITVPEESQTIIEGETSPILSYVSDEGRQFLLAAFSILDERRETIQTQWVFKWHFLAMLSDALQYLSASVSAGAGDVIAPGEAVNLLAPEGARTLTVTRPGNVKDSVPVRFGNVANYADTRAFGVYTVSPATPGSDTFAVCLLNDNESDIAPNDQLTVAGEPVVSGERAQRITRSAWPWILAAALLVLMLEWIVYNRRVFV